jgi:hypothetical protein
MQRAPQNSTATLISVFHRTSKRSEVNRFPDPALWRMSRPGQCDSAINTIIAAFAELERDTIREHTVAGLAAAKAREHVGARPRALSPAKITLDAWLEGTRRPGDCYRARCGSGLALQGARQPGFGYGHPEVRVLVLHAAAELAARGEPVHCTFSSTGAWDRAPRASRRPLERRAIVRLVSVAIRYARLAGVFLGNRSPLDDHKVWVEPRTGARWHDGHCH